MGGPGVGHRARFRPLPQAVQKRDYARRRAETVRKTGAQDFEVRHQEGRRGHRQHRDEHRRDEEPLGTPDGIRHRLFPPHSGKIRQRARTQDRDTQLRRHTGRYGGCGQRETLRQPRNGFCRLWPQKGRGRRVCLRLLEDGRHHRLPQGRLDDSHQGAGKGLCGQHRMQRNRVHRPVPQGRRTHGVQYDLPRRGLWLRLRETLLGAGHHARQGVFADQRHQGLQDTVFHRQPKRRSRNGHRAPRVETETEEDELRLQLRRPGHQGTRLDGQHTDTQCGAQHQYERRGHLDSRCAQNLVRREHQEAQYQRGGPLPRRIQRQRPHPDADGFGTFPHNQLRPLEPL